MTTGARVALLASLAIGWLNFLLTTRWAHVAGSLHGWRRPWFLGVLILASALSAIPDRRSQPRSVGFGAAWAILAAAFAGLLGVFLWWFPPGSWTRIPFLDNWPPRFQSTLDGITLLRHGAVTGWQWYFLGGYHTSSDITQGLAVLGFLPMAVLGPALGFHVLQLVLFASMPALVYADLRGEQPRAWAPLAGGLAALVAGCFSYMFVRSGDVNSLAGLACTALVIVASHAARRGSRWGWPCLVGGVVLTAYSHAGFVMYAFVYVLLDAVCARDGGSFRRALAAFAVGAVVSLPSVWELVRYHEFFNFNNVVYGRNWTVEGPSLARTIYYNVELLFHPGRWSNDYTGLTTVFLPIIGYVAWQERSRRVGFYAAAVLLTVALLRLNASQFGFVFLREVHMLAFFTPPVLAWFFLQKCGSRALSYSLVALVAIYMQIIVPRVPHVDSVSQFAPALVSRLPLADGSLVLVENNPHRDMDADPGSVSVPSAFGVHYEALLAEATGRRLYAGFWDGWQWCPWRGQTLAGGAIFGQRVDRVPPVTFDAEMQRWGIRHLFVWSSVSVNYLRSLPGYAHIWSDGSWHEFLFSGADSRDVVTARGSGTLELLGPLAAVIDLDGVDAGDEVVVRMNFYPAWSLRHDGRALETYARDGQLAFKAPVSGRSRIALAYPRRVGLSLLALGVLVAALAFPVSRYTSDPFGC